MSPRSSIFRLLPWAFGALIFGQSCCHAALIVPSLDWLDFRAGAERTQFNLIDDAGGAFAQAEIQVLSGAFAPSSPSGGILQSQFWETQPDFKDSVLGNGSVATTKIQVAPVGGAVSYRLTLTGADLSGMTFAVGQIFGSGGVTRIEMTTLTAAASGAQVNLLSINGWDDGIRSYTQPVTWNGSQQILSTPIGASGESAVSFFRISASESPVTQLILNIPFGYNGAVGDSVEFAFGMIVVPEPTVSVMIVAGIVALGCSRRRASTSSWD